MKKREKPPEVEAFEQAFDRPTQHNANAGPGVRSNPGWSPGQTPGGSGFGTTSGLWSQSQPRGPGASGLWSSPAGQATGRGVAAGRAQSWGLEDEDELDDFEEDDAGDAPRAVPQSLAPARAPRDRFSGILVSVALALVALFAAYSMQTHSRRQYVPGSIKDTIVQGISYNAGWPLPYAHVAEQQVPLSDVEPAPAFRYIQPAPFALDIILLSVPLWLLLEAVWLFWRFILERFGTRRPLRRFFAISFTALPATLWMLAALGMGVFVGFLSTTGSAWPRYAWPALAPAVPGFGLASAASAVLGIPSNLWTQDFGIFLLVVIVPLTLLTACLYLVFCLIGRSLRKMMRGGRR